jgi:hypothetical protein
MHFEAIVQGSRLRQSEHGRAVRGGDDVGERSHHRRSESGAKGTKRTPTKI